MRTTMKKVFYLVLTLFATQILLSEAGFIKKLVTGVVGGSEKTQSTTTTHNPHDENSHQQHHRPAHRDSNTTHPYRNTTWHIENEDYLTPNSNESSQHKERPSSGYGGGGTYDRRPSTSQPYRRTAFYEELPPVNINMTAHRQQIMHKDDEDNDDLNLGLMKSVKETDKNVSDGDMIILHSDSITCCYSNIRDENIENRKMKCNQTDCRLEKIFVKSSLWICGNIKCTVANVDFSQDVGDRQLMECSMDGRNIITVQDKPVKCGPQEKVHNGRCRQVFGK